ncbi:ribosomal protein S18-alanine N-acetyltransferase [Pseudoalteromonas denitrificans]|uniref:[Ribosomal protein bS18]-alanine N-acetyltransferase n=1 Tax=Pseudoalteromonas denitrificans DSM 6059 TaxID=1123010 RepID=A0A1I1LSL0_9GAMM|nr:ribosomal protein S18-alanine N-acetyltransferase [Pseudoalteromonas denitrificans]SFC75946.1 [SSU ribosomal protein S18P]-alanine acetyltransferase [Pseudoalteromonas denitrificans DSM 6059]
MTQLQDLNASDVDSMMIIEQTCHSHPMSHKNMLSCFGGRYFSRGLYLEQALIGFYMAEMAGPDFTLMDICISPEYQGKGYAKKLLENLLDEATKRSAESIFLEVRVSNVAAIGLYESLGFNEMGLRKDYYPTEQGREDGKLMGLVLFSFS